jgi:hypothetical protein
MPDSNPDHTQPEPVETPEAISMGQKAQDGDESIDGTRQRIRRLPPEVGAVLIAVGVVGVILPGPIGAPFLLAGGLVLVPGFFGRFERWFERRMPTLHWAGMRNVDRFLDNFEKRFPPEAQEESEVSSSADCREQNLSA